MKEIKAYVHRGRIGDVIAALKDCDAWGGQMGDRRHNLAVYLVKGTLVPIDSAEQHYSLDLGDEVINEYKVELLCEDDEVDRIIDVLSAAARTGQPIAGWITVTTVVKAVPVQ